MAYQLSSDDLVEQSQQAIDQLSETFHRQFVEIEQQASAGASSHISISPELGQGSINLWQHEQLLISEQNFSFNRNTQIAEHAFNDLCFISMNLGDDIHFQSQDKQAMNQSRGKIYLGHSAQGDNFRADVGEHAKVHAFSFCFPRALLADYFIDLEREDIADNIRSHKGSGMLREIHINSRQQQLFRQIRNNSFKGKLGEMAFRSHSEQLLLSVLESLSQDKQRMTPHISQQEKEILLYARRILLENPKNPPTIPQLARQCGINQDKLKKGFKVLFDKTVLQTLTEHRMERACEALKTGDMSVAEVADQAGYNNVSHFIATFKRCFNKTPGQMREQLRIYLPD